MMFQWFSFLSYAVITAATPGPNNIMSMSNGSQKGFLKAMPFNLGIWAGFSVVMCLCTAFCSFLSSLIPKIKLPMLILGAAYMLYLAWKVWRSTGDLNNGTGKEAGFLSGMILQFANPKIYIYAITAMSLYILPVYQSFGALCGFTVLLSVIGASGTYVWALFGAAFCKFFSMHARMVNFVMAILLVYCAVSLFH